MKKKNKKKSTRKLKIRVIEMKWTNSPIGYAKRNENYQVCVRVRKENADFISEDAANRLDNLYERIQKIDTFPEIVDLASVWWVHEYSATELREKNIIQKINTVLVDFAEKEACHMTSLLNAAEIYHLTFDPIANVFLFEIFCLDEEEVEF